MRLDSHVNQNIVDGAGKLDNARVTLSRQRKCEIGEKEKNASDELFAYIIRIFGYEFLYLLADGFRIGYTLPLYEVLYSYKWEASRGIARR